MLAPNKTARTNGKGSIPSCCAAAIAIGVPMTAAALLDTMFVNTAMTRMKALMITGVGRPPAALTNPLARNAAMPVATSALPIARLATISIITATGSDRPTSRQPMHPNAIIKPTTIRAELVIGSKPNAAAPTTSTNTNNARLALCALGSPDVPSTTSILPPAFAASSPCRSPCIRTTSPARRRTAPGSLA